MSFIYITYNKNVLATKYPQWKCPTIAPSRKPWKPYTKWPRSDDVTTGLSLVQPRSSTHSLHRKIEIFCYFFFYKSWEIINSLPFVKFFVPSQFSRVYMNSIFKGKYDKLMLMLIHKPIIYPCNFVFPCWFSLGSWTVHGAGTTVFRICVFKFGYARVCSYFCIKKETITLTFGLLTISNAVFNTSSSLIFRLSYLSSSLGIKSRSCCFQNVVPSLQMYPLKHICTDRLRKCRFSF